MKTARGVYNNIKESDYKVEFLDYIFFFSSMFLLEKYMKLVNNYIEGESYKLRNIYNNEIDCKNFLALSFYKKVERRGFYVLDRNTREEVSPDKYFIIN